MTETTALRVAELAQNRPTAFDIRPAAQEMRALAAELGLDGLRKLRFHGEITAEGRSDWRLAGHLGATIVQPCVVTLDPVTTRIETDVARSYVAELPELDSEEIEMPEDDSIEALGKVIDPAAVMAEALALAVPLYPRSAGAELGSAVFAKPGTTPMRDEDTRPFAGLAKLRDSLDEDG